MRKYQQLLLIVLSVLSLVILLIYRSENNRLRYVLEVVNFFGRTDVSSTTNNRILDNNATFAAEEFDIDFINPMPVWQRIGKGFFAYSSYWIKSNQTTGGVGGGAGEVHTIVVGLPSAIVGFQCLLKYSNGTLQTGKFGFVRDQNSVQEQLQTNDVNDAFIFYRFICKATSTKVINAIPEKVVFKSTKFKSKYMLPIRNPVGALVPKQSISICLTQLKSIESSINRYNHILQYFFHHHLIGVNDFLVYDTGFMNTHLHKTLAKKQIHINVFPFNFPFGDKRFDTIHQIIQTDCLYRTKHLSTFTILAEPNDFLYAKSNLDMENGPLDSLAQNNPQKINRFDLKTERICVNSLNPLFDNNLSQQIISSFPMKSISLFRLGEFGPDTSIGSIETNKNEMFVHHYDISCVNNKTDSSDDWRLHVGAEFLQYIDLIQIKVKTLLANT